MSKQSGFEERVGAALTERCGVASDATILALVSGGADSVALMHLLRAVRPRAVIICSVDHGLRAESVAEVEAVCAQADGLGLVVHTRRLSIAAGAGLQERARSARYAAAQELCNEVGADVIATGHTATDQVETVLFRLARGTGRHGALGMSYRRGNIIRPLLGVTRAETREYCAAHRLPFVDDPSNDDDRFTRSRIRHGLLAELDRVHPGAQANVNAFVDRLRDEGALLTDLVEAAAERCADGDRLGVAALAAEPVAIQRLLARRLVESAGLPTASSATVDRLIAMLASGGVVQIGAGAIATNDRGRLGIESPKVAAQCEAVAFAVPGRVSFGSVSLEAGRGPARPPTPHAVSIDHPGPFVVRGPVPGDRLEMAGGWHKRVGHLLADVGVEACDRIQVPIVTADGVPVWVAGHRAATAALAEPGRAASNLNLQSLR